MKKKQKWKDLKYYKWFFLIQSFFVLSIINIYIYIQQFYVCHIYVCFRFLNKSILFLHSLWLEWCCFVEAYFVFLFWICCCMLVQYVWYAGMCGMLVSNNIINTLLISAKPWHRQFGYSAIFKWQSRNPGNLAIQQSHLTLCEPGRCPVGQATIKQEQQCKTMEQKQRANYFYNKSSYHHQSINAPTTTIKKKKIYWTKIINWMNKKNKKKN